MKKIIVFLLLIGFAFASFSVKTVNVEFIIHKNYIEAREVIDIFIQGQKSISDYSITLKKADLASWIQLVGEDVRLYVDRRYVKVNDLKVRPQPLRNYDPVNQKANGKIIITYKITPFSDINNTGLFLVKKIKPRLFEYKINPNALSFIRNNNGDILVDERTTLMFVFPNNAYITDINPRPNNIKQEFLDYPIHVDEVYWHNTVLPHFSLSFIIKEGLDDEIIESFTSFFDSLFIFVSSFEGQVFVLLSIIVLGFYISLIRKTGGL